MRIRNSAILVLGCATLIAIGTIFADGIFGGYIDVRFANGVTLSGMHSGWFGGESLYEMEVDLDDLATKSGGAEPPFICLTDEALPLPDLTVDRLVGMGATPHPRDSHTLFYRILDAQGTLCCFLEFTFRSEKLMRFAASTAQCDLEHGLALCAPDSSERLAFPCNGHDARAFLGEPLATARWRGR